MLKILAWLICCVWVSCNENGPTSWFSAPTLSPFACLTLLCPFSPFTILVLPLTSVLCFILVYKDAVQFEDCILSPPADVKVCWLYLWVFSESILLTKKSKCKCLFIHHRWVQRNAGLVITCILCSASAFKSQMQVQSKFDRICQCWLKEYAVVLKQKRSECRHVERLAVYKQTTGVASSWGWGGMQGGKEGRRMAAPLICWRSRIPLRNKKSPNGAVQVMVFPDDVFVVTEAFRWAVAL